MSSILNSDGWAVIWKMAAELRNQGATGSRYYESSETLDKKWSIVKQEIDAGRPLIVGVGTTSAGHLITAVGYHEENGTHLLIAYDPYGHWLGTVGSYDRNSADSASHKGQWVYYDFAKLKVGNLITAAPLKAVAVTVADGSLTPPDEISLESPDIVTFDGVPIEEGRAIFLPVVKR